MRKQTILWISPLIVIIVVQFILLYQQIMPLQIKDTISTITIEQVSPVSSGKKSDGLRWRLVANPAPDKDLVVIVGQTFKQDNWYDIERESFPHGVRDRWDAPFYVIIPKFEKHSQTFKPQAIERSDEDEYGEDDIIRRFLLPFQEDTPVRKFLPLPIYINPLPIMSIVGKGIHIDTDTLAQTLPAKTYCRHIIPKGHQFVRYQVGNTYGINKDGKLITK